MGEAKRRRQQDEQVAARLQRRVAAGDFGAPDAAHDYCIVLDKSVDGVSALVALRSMRALAGLAPLLDGEALRVWQASSLFAYAVLHGAAAASEPARCLLAADARRLHEQVLPRALAAWRRSSRQPGLELAVEATLQQELGRVCQAILARNN